MTIFEVIALILFIGFGLVIGLILAMRNGFELDSVTRDWTYPLIRFKMHQLDETVPDYPKRDETETKPYPVYAWDAEGFGKSIVEDEMIDTEPPLTWLEQQVVDILSETDF